MFICAEATQHKERATIPRGFSWLLRRVQPIFPNPCQDLRFRCILLPPTLLYEEWSNQAWKWVSSVCWWVKRDFQNNPISRGGFSLFYELHFFFFWYFSLRVVPFNIAQDTAIIAEIPSSWMPGPPFFSFFFFFFVISGGAHKLLCRTTASVMQPRYYSVSWQVIFCQMKCWIASYSPRKAEVIHVSRIKLLYSILQPRRDCGCSSIFNKCLFPRGPCWALWVNSVQEGKACSPHSGAL